MKGDIVLKKIGDKNLFGYNRYGFAFEYIKDSQKWLDYGCFDGAFIKKVCESKQVEFYGVDKNKDAVTLSLSR